MRNAQAASKAVPLIDRLNQLRVRRVDSIQTELDQVRFQAQGLKRVNPAAYLAISSMIAAIEDDGDAVRDLAEQLEAEFPFEIGSHINVLRSLLTVADRAQIKLQVARLAERIDDPRLAGVVAYSLLAAGEMSAALATIQSFDRLPGTSSLAQTFSVANSLLQAGIDDETLAGYIDRANEHFLREGWCRPIMSMHVPLRAREDGPKAIARFVVDAAPEEVLATEDALMDAFIAARDPLFCNGIVVSAVVNFPSDDA